jgi:predicted amidophosphoribosyltransferase
MDSKLFVKDFTDLISQKYCFYCGKIEEVICAQCVLLQVNNSKIHFINNIPVLSMMRKDKIISSLVVAYKDQGVSTLKDPFARILSFGLKYFSKHKYMKVVNVPSSVKAIQKRGLDPISLMTENACKISGKRFQFDQNLLVNNKNRKDQSTLNFKQRKINMQDAFKANHFESKPVLIIDDLTTTGATLLSSIIAMKKRMIKVEACVVLVSSD